MGQPKTQITNNSNPTEYYMAVTPNDTDRFLSNSRGLYVGSAGDLTVVAPDGDFVKFASVPAGTLLPVACRGVRTTGTTAGGLVALF